MSYQGAYTGSSKVMTGKVKSIDVPNERTNTKKIMALP